MTTKYAPGDKEEYRPLLFADVVRELRAGYRRAGYSYHEAHARAKVDASRHFQLVLDTERTARDRSEARSRDG